MAFRLSVEEAHPSRGIRPLPFLGRDLELSQLRACAAEAATGHGALVLVTGEPGIGKTRLATELAHHAGTTGADVHWGRCWEGGGAPAFWPWSQVLRPLLERWTAAPSDPRRAALVAHVQQLLPSSDAIARPSAPAPESARLLLFEAVTEMLRGVAEERTLVVVLDDLHAADLPSLLLLERVAMSVATMPMLVVATYRDHEMRRRDDLTRARLAVARNGRHMELRGLERGDVSQLLAWNLGMPPAERLLSAIHRTTGGNPFFIDEVLRGPDLTGGTHDAPRIPEGARDAVALRLERLTPACVQMLEMAAVFGDEGSLTILQRALDLPPATVLDAFAEAEREGMLRPDTDRRYRFAHGLVREVIHAAIPASRRATLHERAGTTLEQVYGRASELHLPMLAHHFFATLPGGDVERAVDYGRRAAERALAMLAYEEAVAWFERADAALLLGPARPQHRLALLLGLGEALDAANEISRARQAFGEAATLARQLGDGVALAQAALGAGGLWARKITSSFADHSVPELLDEALAALPPADSALRARLLGRIALSLRFSQTPATARAVAADAVAMARRLDDPATLAAVLMSEHAMLLGPDGTPERARIAGEILALGEAMRDRELLLRAHALVFLEQLELDDIPAATHAWEAHARLAAGSGDPYELWFTAAARATLALLAGRFDEANGLAAEALGNARRIPGREGVEELTLLTYAAQRFFAAKWRGVPESLLAELAELHAQYPDLPRLDAALAFIPLTVGAAEAARTQFDAVMTVFDTLPRDATWLGTVALLAAAAVELRDAERATRLYERLLPFADRNLTQSYAACMGSAARTLGRLALVMGRIEIALLHLETALARNERMGAWPWVAETQYDLAVVLLERGAPGDRERARDLAARSRSLAERLDMPTLSDRLARLDVGAPDPGLATAPATTARAPVSFRLRQEGQFWTVGGDPLVRLRDMRGFAHITLLVRHPHREFHALDLVALASHRGAADVAPHTDDEHVGSLLDSASRNGTPDAQARSDYRRRLAVLEREMADARAASDPGQLVEMAEEAHLLQEALFDRGRGADRRGSAAERARLNVTRTLWNAVGRIEEFVPDLARHLRHSLRTGTFCSYVPDPLSAVSWDV